MWRLLAWGVGIFAIGWSDFFVSSPACISLLSWVTIDRGWGPVCLAVICTQSVCQNVSIQVAIFVGLLCFKCYRFLFGFD
jgi:hypothetical protein